MAAKYLSWLERDRERFGFSAAQVASHLSISRREYLELEAVTRRPTSTVWERMVALYGWPG
jgi:hypothetical protein